MNKLKYTITIFFWLLFANTAVFAQTNNTTIDFKIKNIGMYVKGTFSEATISTNFDTDNISKSFIKATINVKSINTKNKKRDKHLLEDDYFDGNKYQQIKLQSTKIEKTGIHTYKLTGKLTIKKTTKTITFPITVNKNAKGTTINASFDLNRRDYGVGGRSWVMSNTVKIQVTHTFKS